jgi:hypothetical protein
MKALLRLFLTILSNTRPNFVRLPTPNDTTLLRRRARVAVAFALLVLLYLVPAQTAAGAMKLLSSDTGWVTSLGHLYWTTDGGDHWTDITPIPPEVPQPNLGGVLFRGISEGWAVISYSEQAALRTPHALGDSKTLYSIAHTLDSGASWSFTPGHLPRTAAMAPG